MRKIENAMIQAVYANESGNPHGSRSEIYLHDNLIAEYWHDQTAAPLEVNRATLARWPSNTTKSRLRALGANVRTVKGRTLLNDEEV